MDNFFVDDILNKFNFEAGDQTVKELPKKPQIKIQEALGLGCFPQFGQYGFEYNWAQPCMAMRCFPTSQEQK